MSLLVASSAIWVSVMKGVLYNDADNGRLSIFYAVRRFSQLSFRLAS